MPRSRRSKNSFALLEQDEGDFSIGHRAKKTDKNKKKKRKDRDVQQDTKGNDLGDWQTAGGKRKRVVKEKIEETEKSVSAETKFQSIAKSLSEGKVKKDSEIIAMARLRLEEEDLDWNLPVPEIKRKVIQKIHEIETKNEMERKISSDEEFEDEEETQSATTGTTSEQVEEIEATTESSQLWNESKEEEIIPPPRNEDEVRANDIPPPKVEKPLDLKEKLLQELDQFDFEKEETAEVIDGWIRLLKGEGHERQEFQKAFGPSKIVMKILRSPKSCIKYEGSLVLLFDQILQGSHEYHAWIFTQFANLSEIIREASLTKNAKVKIKIEETATQLMELLMKEPEDPVSNSTPQRPTFVPPSTVIFQDNEVNLNTGQWKNLDMYSEQMHKSTFALSNCENEVHNHYKPKIFEKLQNQRDKIAKTLLEEKMRVTVQERQYTKKLDEQKRRLTKENTKMHGKTRPEEEHRAHAQLEIRRCQQEKVKLERKLVEIEASISKFIVYEEKYKEAICRASEEHQPKIRDYEDRILDTEMRLKAQQLEGQCYKTLEKIAESFSEHLSNETNRTHKAKLEMRMRLEQKYVDMVVQYTNQAYNLYQDAQKRCTFLQSEILDLQKKNPKFQEYNLQGSLKKRAAVLEHYQFECEQFKQISNSLKTLMFKIKNDAKTNLSPTHIVQLIQSLNDRDIPREFAPEPPQRPIGGIGSHLNAQLNFRRQPPPQEHFTNYPPSSKRKPPMNSNLAQYGHIGFPMQNSFDQQTNDETFEHPMDNPPRPERYEEEFEQHGDYEPRDPQSYSPMDQDFQHFQQPMEHNYDPAQGQAEIDALSHQTQKFFNEDTFNDIPEEIDNYEDPQTYHTTETASNLQNQPEPISDHYPKNKESDISLPTETETENQFQSSAPQEAPQNKHPARKPPMVSNPPRPVPIEKKSEKPQLNEEQRQRPRRQGRRRSKTKQAVQSGKPPQTQNNKQQPLNKERAVQGPPRPNQPRTQGKSDVKMRRQPQRQQRGRPNRGGSKPIQKAANKKQPTQTPPDQRPSNKKDPAKPQQSKAASESPQETQSPGSNWSNLVGKKPSNSAHIRVDSKDPKEQSQRPQRTARGRGRARNTRRRGRY